MSLALRGVRTVRISDRRPGQRGITLIEMMIVMAVMGLMLAIAIPRMRVSSTRKVEMAARQLLRDLELSRTRALSTKKIARVSFDVPAGSYVGYLDDDRDGIFAQSQAETQALQGFGNRELPGDITFGRGSAGPVPSDSAAGVITFANSRVEFDSRGVTMPFGTRGTIYLVHRDDPKVVAAVAVSGSASFQLWVYKSGAWQ